MKEEIKNKLLRYADLLGEANKRARLTGPSDPKTLYEDFILDALYGLPFLEGCGSFVDVGTGGGLPGIVWGICRPDIEGILLDSIGKKISLVQEMIKELGCGNLTAVNSRSEDFAASNREKFGAATARALASAPLLAEYLSPLVRVGGKIIAFKGEHVHEEISLPKRSWSKLGLSAPTLEEYALSGKRRYILVWEKVKACPEAFPRKPGLAAKTPWFDA